MCHHKGAVKVAWQTRLLRIWIARSFECTLQFPNKFHLSYQINKWRHCDRTCSRSKQYILNFVCANLVSLFTLTSIASSHKLHGDLCHFIRRKKHADVRTVIERNHSGVKDAPSWTDIAFCVQVCTQLSSKWIDFCDAFGTILYTCRDGWLFTLMDICRPNIATQFRSECW